MPVAIVVYVVAVNLAAFALSFIDKWCAVTDRARPVSGKALLYLGVLGGSIGLKLGQAIFMHKALDTDFTVSLTLIVYLQISVAAAVAVSMGPRIGLPDVRAAFAGEDAPARPVVRRSGSDGRVGGVTILSVGS